MFQEFWGNVIWTLGFSAFQLSDDRREFCRGKGCSLEPISAWSFPKISGFLFDRTGLILVRFFEVLPSHPTGVCEVVSLDCLCPPLSALLVETHCQIRGLGDSFFAKFSVQECVVACVTLFVPCGDVPAMIAARNGTLRCPDEEFAEDSVGFVQIGGGGGGEAGDPEVHQTCELVSPGLAEMPPLHRFGWDRLDEVVRDNQRWGCCDFGK